MACLPIPEPQSSCLRNLEVPQAASRGVTLAAGGLSLQISVTTRTYLHDTLKQYPHMHTPPHPHHAHARAHSQITLSWEMGTMPPQAGDYRFN